MRRFSFAVFSVLILFLLFFLMRSTYIQSNFARSSFALFKTKYILVKCQLTPQCVGQDSQTRFGK
ncbi:hypothetical protein Pan110_46580 [Gimesia panareensis]|nr:hypothetical protein Pan110_46580 [Gimesia panareensis]